MDMLHVDGEQTTQMYLDMSKTVCRHIYICTVCYHTVQCQWGLGTSLLLLIMLHPLITSDLFTLGQFLLETYLIHKHGLEIWSILWLIISI